MKAELKARRCVKQRHQAGIKNTYLMTFKTSAANQDLNIFQMYSMS